MASGQITPQRWVVITALMALLAGLISVVQATTAPAPASAVLPTGFTATKVGWNVLGLDSNRVTVGPNQFPNGVYMCNTSGATISGSSVWKWTDNTNATNIYLADNPSATDDTVTWTLSAGACQSVYWTVEVARATSSYFKTRNFKITVNTTTPSATSTDIATNQQIYVEKLVSQNRNIVGAVTGPGIAPDTTPIYVGQEYTYSVAGATAPGGYEQLAFAAVFDPRFFEIIEVSQNYAANTAPASRVPNPNYQVYADGCGWNNTTRACTSTGKVGGNMTSTYRVRVIGSGTARLNTLIYDFSGSSYHYNADFGAGPSITTLEKALTVTKTANTSSYSAIGNSINFTVAVTNTGTLPISNLVIDDTTSRAGYNSTPLAFTSCSPTLPATLQPDDTVTCTAAYSTTQNDLNAGAFTNTATARGTTTSGSVSGEGSTSLTYTGGGETMVVTKTASPMTFTSTDETITYTIAGTYSNQASNVDWVFTDPLIDVWGAGCPTKNNQQSPQTCVGYHRITAEDRARGYITNTATVTATGANSSKSGRATVTVNYIGLPSSISMTKTASSPTYGDDSTLTYTFVVTNTGDDTITSLTIDDTQLNAPATCAKTTLVGGLNPDDSTTCTGLRTFTLVDVNAGSVTNNATAKGFNSRNLPVTANASTTVTASAAAPALTISKSSTSEFFTGAGDVVPFNFVVTNTGNVTVNNITVSDDTITSPPGITCQTRNLVPGASTTCVGRYTATAADEARQLIPNVASVSGAPARGTSPTTATSNVIMIPWAYSEITATKIARDDTVAGVGSSTTFDIRIINTGNLNLTNVTVDDTVYRTLGVNSNVPVTCSRSLPTSLNVDDSFTCTASYTFTQADVDQGYVDNTVLALGDDTTTAIVDDSAVARVLGPARTPGLSIEKIALTDTYSAVDDTVLYQYRLQNTGNVTLTNVSVDDSKVLPQPIPCVSTTLAPGQTTTCEAYYLITSSDLNLQWLENTATATATPPSGTVLPPVTPSSAYVLKVSPPQLRVTKTVSDDTFASADDTRTYTITVRNVSVSDTIYDLTISDPLFEDTTPPISPFGSLTCNSDDTTLPPNTTKSCTGIYDITQADVNNGYVNNTVTAIGLDDTTPGARVLIARDSVTITGPSNVTTAITVAKSTPTTQYSSVGQVVPFNFLVTNTGDVTLNNVEVLDGTLTSGPTCPSLTLAPDDTFICTGTYTISAADLSQGRIVNVATATGVPTRGTQPTAAPSTAIVPRASVAPNMTVTKSQTASTYSAVGQTLSYSIVVTNTGDDTLSAVTLDDTVTRTGSGATAGTLGSCSPVALPGTLNPGQSTTCGATYVTTAGESTAGGTVTNTATGRATPASGGSLTRTSAVTATFSSPTPPPPPPPPAASIGVTKTADPTTFTKAGDRIAYTVVATNTGQEALTNVTVTDPKVTLTCTPSTPTSMAVGARITCTGDYTITQADVEAGRVDNTATATGTPPSGTPVTGTGTSRITGNPTGGLTVTKSASPSTFTKAGDRITYTVVATNTGDITLTGITVTDPKVTLTCSPTIPATLAPGAKITCTGTYVITQSDVDAGSVSNTASASGKDPSGKDVTGFDTKRITTPSEGKITVTKSASPTRFSKVGDRITYTVVAANSGEVTLAGVTVTDPKVALTCSPTTPATLAPGAKVTCTGTYAVSQDDVDAGYVDNSATARGTDPGGRPTEGTGTKTVPGVPTPGLEVTKSANPTTFAKIGDSLRFTVVATNTGTATLTGVTVTDPNAPLTCSPATPARLAPGAKVTCTGSYPVTQDDLDAGKVSNTATATGKDPSGKDITGRGTTEVPGPVREPSLHVAKSAAPTTFGAVGDRVAFTVVATNNGNVTLTGVTVSDPLVDLRCAPTTPATLAPGAALTCTGTYRVTQADVDRGAITNTATGRGTDPGGNPVTGTGSTQVPGLAPNPRLEFTKSASPSTATAVGQAVTYSFTVTNSGDVTIRSIAVSDPMLSASTNCQATSLAPGASTTCTGTYLVTSTDLDRGSITNVATATGSPARGTLAPVTATVTINAEKTWLKATEKVTRQGAVTEVAVDRIRESPNLNPPRITVACVPTGSAPRGDFSYCTWRQAPRGIVVTTTGRPVKVTVTIRAQLRNDPSVWVKKKYVIRTKA